MAESLLCLLSTALGLAAVEQPAEADSEEFFDNVLTMLGEPCLLDVRPTAHQLSVCLAAVLHRAPQFDP